MIDELSKAIQHVNQMIIDYQTGLNYYYSIEVYSKAYPHNLIGIRIIAVENGIATYDPVKGSDRKTVTLLQEELNYAIEKDLDGMWKFLEQRVLNSILGILLLGKDSPLVIRRRELMSTDWVNEDIKLIQ